ncbi:hypothetical protein Q7A53_09455 [Halobacillus rhizosphaerae]
MVTTFTKIQPVKHIYSERSESEGQKRVDQFGKKVVDTQDVVYTIIELTIVVITIIIIVRMNSI